MSASRQHHYRCRLTWDEPGDGTVEYKSYSRRFRVAMDGKPDLVGTADPSFRGDPTIHNPEDLLVASLSSCHMLSYLALCALRGVRVLGYTDQAEGRMVTTRGGGGRFEEVVLRPHVVVAQGADVDLARALHRDAHDTCFIASSVSFPVTCEPDVVVVPAAG